jgi:hypothetical protein
MYSDLLKPVFIIPIIAILLSAISTTVFAQVQLELVTKDKTARPAMVSQWQYRLPSSKIYGL